MNVIGGATISFDLTQTGPLALNDSAAIPVNPTFRSNFGTAGVLLDQCDRLHAFPYDLAAGTPQSIDLSALSDVAGNAIGFARVRLLALRIRSRVEGYTVLVGGGPNPFAGFVSAGGILTAYPSSPGNDGFILFQAPNTAGALVTPTSKIIKLDPGATAVGKVDVIVAGCST